LTAHDLNEQIRIHPRSLREDSSVDDWFRYDAKGIFVHNVYDSVAKQVLKNIKLIEKVFDDWPRQVTRIRIDFEASILIELRLSPVESK